MATQGNSGAASGGQLEEKMDYRADTDACLAQCAALAAAGALSDALPLLAALEKRCRSGNDTASLVRVCAAAVQTCRTAGDPDALLATLAAYATKRSQKAAAVTALVATALPWCVDNTATTATGAATSGSTNTASAPTYGVPVAVANAAEKTIRDQLVASLRDITDGKLFLERERAQLTRAWATIKVRACPLVLESRMVC